MNRIAVEVIQDVCYRPVDVGGRDGLLHTPVTATQLFDDTREDESGNHDVIPFRLPAGGTNRLHDLSAVESLLRPPSRLYDTPTSLGAQQIPQRLGSPQRGFLHGIREEREHLVLEVIRIGNDDHPPVAMCMGHTHRSADRFSPHVDEETVRLHYVLKIRFDELVRARLWVYEALDRIEKRHLRAVLTLDRLTPATHLGVIASRDGTGEVHAKPLASGHLCLQTNRTDGQPGLASDIEIHGVTNEWRPDPRFRGGNRAPS